jgi:Na+/H+ antiporter NhaD/arsenite permease-like protein
MIGASANIISAGMLKKYDHEISFGAYFRRSAPGAILSLIICSIVLMVYLRIFL